MTWNTPSGARVLARAEANLFANAVVMILAEYKEFWPQSGLNYGERLTWGPFEQLTDPQKMAVLEEVAEALLTETPVPVQKSTAENAIYYVFRWIVEQFKSEIIEIGEQEKIWGQDVLDALGRCGRDPDTPGGGAEGMDRDDSEEEDPEEAPDPPEGGADGMDCDDLEEEDPEEAAFNAAHDPYIGCRDVKKWEDALEEIADRILWDRDWELTTEIASNPGWMAYCDIHPDYFNYSVPTHKCRGAGDRLAVLCSRHITA
jgi:hypothetical protein